MKYTKCLQLVTKHENWSNARELADIMLDQETLIGLRILKPSLSKPNYRVQLFFECDSITKDTLPEDCRIVMLPETLEDSLEKP